MKRHWHSFVEHALKKAYGNHLSLSFTAAAGTGLPSVHLIAFYVYLYCTSVIAVISAGFRLSEALVAKC